MAPEFWYPTQLLDCEAAATHFLQHAEEYGVDPERITIMGNYTQINPFLIYFYNIYLG